MRSTINVDMAVRGGYKNGSSTEMMACQIEHAKWRYESGQENKRQDMG